MVAELLSWMPPHSSWSAALEAVSGPSDNAAWPALVGLAQHQLGMVATIQLDRQLRRACPNPPASLATRPVRLAVLGSCTLDHLLPGIRVGALRRGLHLTACTADFGQYVMPLLDSSQLQKQAPDAVLLALDARHVTGGIVPTASAIEVASHLDTLFDRLRGLWRAAQSMGAAVLHQAALPVFPALLGEAEYLMPGSPATLVVAYNERLRREATDASVLVLGIDRHVAQDGIAAWHDETLWHRAKQDIHPAMVPFYGDLVGRLLAARQGRSAKCLVLDLDNTLWGGVIGDDGIDGIVLGQGSALGEAFAGFQAYAKALSQRGVILAVCSKNDEVNALAVFDRHPEMVLRRDDIACFAVNWSDKAHNLRAIAETLNIGIDALVFADDNPAERAVIRRELPAVAVPELPVDPALYAATLARAGYFEAVALTGDDLQRGQQYQQNFRRMTLADSVTDMDGYLAALGMVGEWSPFRSVDRQRVVQLVNKTNQFNLTTRRYTEADVTKAMADECGATLQLRLLDQFGDNGIVALAVLQPTDQVGLLEIDTWLMSCRVLKRGVELAMLALLVGQARALGATSLRGRYIPTAKNGMVDGHYAGLGFMPESRDSNATLWHLDLARFHPAPHHIKLTEIREVITA